MRSPTRQIPGTPSPGPIKITPPTSATITSDSSPGVGQSEHPDPLTDARQVVLRHGDAVARWHRADDQFSTASRELLKALADPTVDEDELTDLRMGVWVALQQYHRLEDELVPLEVALDEALLVLAETSLQTRAAA